MASLEERCVSLKSTIDQLNCSLEKAAMSESELKAEAQRLQRNLMETMSTQQTESERIKQVKKDFSMVYLFVTQKPIISKKQ